ncbi:hypothetical protein MUK42_21629 [Musa troglodytarum]|uniref:Uncharacterized protein n=1 Tax=Musa troglodytarum TaxID=320322 RepID=A0A9E7GE03_9LILI|nr:hypothetical protein MUK42_21629 [Musa troglodytarum]
MVCSSADHSIDSPGLCFSACAGPGVVPLLGFPGTEEPPPPASPPPARNGPLLAPSGFPDGLALAPINRKTSQPPILRSHRSLRPIRTFLPSYIGRRRLRTVPRIPTRPRKKDREKSGNNLGEER